MIPVALLIAALALAGGLIAGAWAVYRPASAFGIARSFLVWLGLVAMASTTFAQSMDALPLTLILAAAIGALPFWCGYAALAAAARRIRSRR